MTTPQEQFTDLTRRGQEAVTVAMQTWAENMQRLAGTVPIDTATVPSAEEVVDNVFNFAEQMLSTQREFTKSLLAATNSATPARPAPANPAAKKS